VMGGSLGHRVGFEGVGGEAKVAGLGLRSPFFEGFEALQNRERDGHGEDEKSCNGEEGPRPLRPS